MAAGDEEIEQARLEVASDGSVSIRNVLEVNGCGGKVNEREGIRGGRLFF